MLKFNKIKKGESNENNIYELNNKEGKDLLKEF